MRPTAYRRNARGLRDRQAFEHVRIQAGQLFAAGRSQAKVARQLGVARQNVSRWHAAGDKAGWRRWQAAAPPGPTRALTTSSSTTWTKRCARSPACMGSTPTTGPLPASPP
jgi:transposase